MKEFSKISAAILRLQKVRNARIGKEQIADSVRANLRLRAKW